MRRLSGLLTSRFILRILAYARDTTPQSDAAGRSRAGFSLTDEFGDDPLSVVFRVSANSANATTAVHTATEVGHDDAVIAEFLEEMGRGLDGAHGEDEMLASADEPRFDEEKLPVRILETGTEDADGSRSSREANEAGKRRKSVHASSGSLRAEA